MCEIDGLGWLLQRAGNKPTSIVWHHVKIRLQLMGLGRFTDGIHDLPFPYDLQSVKFVGRTHLISDQSLHARLATHCCTANEYSPESMDTKAWLPSMRRNFTPGAWARGFPLSVIASALLAGR